MGRDTALGYFDSVDEEGRYRACVAHNNQRREDYRNGSCTIGGGLPEEAPQYLKDYIDYCKTGATMPGAAIPIMAGQLLPEVSL